MTEDHARAMMTTHSRREEGGIFRIGSVAGIAGALPAIVGNLLHPATPIRDPKGAATDRARRAKDGKPKFDLSTFAVWPT